MVYKKYLTFVVFFSLAFYSYTLAAAPPPPAGVDITLAGIDTLIASVVNFLIYVAGGFVTIFLIWTGVRWLSAGANSAQAQDAKKMFITTLWGAVVVLGIYVIMETVMKIVTTRSLY